MITVEFYSIPKLRAGTGQLAVAAKGPMRLGELLGELAIALPSFGEGCLDEAGLLQRHYLAILDDKHRPDSTPLNSTTPIPNDSTVLILSADAGG